jgi:G3E family GTPase
MSLAAHRPDPDRMGEGRRAGERGATIPTVLVTGFLGAGKSTLLARLLEDPGGAGVVRAVVNDVGRLPLDPTLVAGADRSGVELANGCGCCVAGAAAEVADALDRAASGADLVVLEASGTADPLALAQVVEARPGLRLERIAAVLDAVAVDELVAGPSTAGLVRRQLDAADVVVLSHADAMEPGDLAAVVERTAVLVPGRPVVVSTRDRPAHRSLAPGTAVGAAPGPPRPNPAATDLVVETIEATVPIGPADLERLLARRSSGLLRAKGWIRLDDGRMVLIQVTPSGATITDWPGDHEGRGVGALTVVASTATVVAEIVDGLTA